MKMVVENVVETIASLNSKEEALQDEINDRYLNRDSLETRESDRLETYINRDCETKIMEGNEKAAN